MMNQSTDFPADQLIEAFSQRLEVLASQHRQTCAVMGAVRLMHDLDEFSEPSAQSSRLTRRARWLLRALDAVQTAVQSRSWPFIPDVLPDLADAGERVPEDDVIIIDAEYRVLTPDQEP